MSAKADAIERAAEILGEHFEGFLIVTCEDTEDGRGEAVRIEIGGGAHLAIGLAARAQTQLLHGDPDDIEQING